jgi:hypothetical protein
MGDGLGVVIAILVMVVIALQVYSMWPEDEEDVDASNPVGFSAYDPEEHEHDEEPYEV